MDDQQNLRALFQRYLNNECSPQEIRFLIAHFSSDSKSGELKEMIGEALKPYSMNDDNALSTNKAYIDNKFQEIVNRINIEEGRAEEEEVEEIEATYNRPVWIKITALCTVVALLFTGTYIYFKPGDSEAVPVARHHEKPVILPGGNKATLTLQDGSTIVLNDAKNGTLAQQGNARVVKLANGQVVYDNTSAPADKILYNTMTTPRGGQYKLTLPDGTDVWLNSASSITYPTAFAGKERNVKITGEAYFEVAKDKSKPFHVKAGNQDIEVLGTHFNVMAYADEENIKTTLLEGSVKVTGRISTSILKPGEQSVVDKMGMINIKQDVTEEAMAWKNGYFKFNRVDIKTIMRQVARWYDVDVTYDGNTPKDEFVGKIGRGENISQVLRLLELENVHFKIEGKKIIVLP